MSDIAPAPGPATAPSAPAQGTVTLVHVVYALYLFGCLSTVTWWFPVASLLTASFLIGLVLAYVKKGDAAGTWAESHFRWQIRSFWLALAGTILGWALAIVLVGFVILLAVTVWLIYRILRGWLLANEEKPVPE